MAAPIHAKAIIEIVGSPQDYVEQILDKVLEQLKARDTITLLKHERFGTQKVENQPFWSAFLDVDIETKNLDHLADFCFHFMPSSVEIMNAPDLTFAGKDIENVFNDLLARLHEYDLAMKNLQARTILLQRKLGQETPPTTGMQEQKEPQKANDNSQDKKKR